MQTIAKITRYSYENKTTLKEREYILQWYEQGYAIRRIAMALSVRTDAVRHHLKAFGVLEVHRKVRQWNKPIKFSKHPAPLLQSQMQLIVDPRMPVHIQEVYIKMHNEDMEMRNRKVQKISKRHVAHKHLLAPAMIKDAPFKVMYAFVL